MVPLLECTRSFLSYLNISASPCLKSLSLMSLILLRKIVHFSVYVSSIRLILSLTADTLFVYNYRHSISQSFQAECQEREGHYEVEQTDWTEYCCY